MLFVMMQPQGGKEIIEADTEEEAIKAAKRQAEKNNISVFAILNSKGNVIYKYKQIINRIK